MIKYIFVVLSLLLVGCSFITLEISESTTVDIGDGTEDNYHDDKAKTEEDILQLDYL